MFGLAQEKPEGGFTVNVEHFNHPLSGRKFEALKDCCQHYSGRAMVIRQLKSGMMLCIGDDGEFQETLTKIRRHLIE